MARETELSPPGAQGWPFCALVTLLAAAGALAIHIPNYLHQDVAWLSWAADRVMRGDVYGRDLLEVNPPLSMLVYVPAALLGRLVGLDLAIKLWIVFIAAVSMGLLWQTAERRIRFPVIIALGLFFVLAFPREFGQREQLALLLTAPYVAGPARHRGHAVLSGVMAGIGFALKPFFLIALLLVFITRRRIRTEEVAIAATGALYAAGLLLFFQPWLTEMLPKAAAFYYGGSSSAVMLIVQLGFIVPAMVGIMWLVSEKQPGTQGFAMAAIGFTLAVILQNKGFAYHFVACFGFLALYLAAMLRNGKRLARIIAALFLLAEAYILPPFTINWFSDREGRNPIVPALLAEIDRAKSFTVLTNYNFPAFPTAILTSTPYLGMAPHSALFSAAIVAEKAGSANAAELRQMVLDQAITELARKPDLVIVGTEWSYYARLDTPVDGLAWFERDPRFAALWQNYTLTGRFGDYQFWLRK